jgi:hypothetical protein
LGSGLENISVINMIFSDGLEVHPGTKLSNNNGNEFIVENTQGRYGYAFGWTNFSLEPLSVSDDEELLTVRRAEFAKLEDFDIVFGEIVAGGRLYTVSLDFDFNDIEIDEKSKSSNGFVSIAPNPSSGYVNLQINNLEFGKYKIKVMDMVGRQVLTQSLDVQTREVNRELSLGHLIPGVYAISIEGGNYFTSELFVINR